MAKNASRRSDSRDLARFGDVDTTGDPEFFIRYVDQVSALPSVRDRKQQILERLEVSEGHRVLDVGCGTGDDVRAIARLVRGSGWVVGVDNSRAMVAEATRRSAGNAPTSSKASSLPPRRPAS